MTDIATASGVNQLSPAELEQLHIRLATAASLNDPNIATESIISDILSGREEPVPLYTAESVSTETENAIRQQIANKDGKLWDAVFKAVQQGQLDVVDRFIKLGFDINSPHPKSTNYALYVAVKASQVNMMRHLINLKADVNSWSAIPLGEGSWQSTIYLPERARTPLMCASDQGSLNICKILCETAFADPMLIAPDGQTAQRLAAKKGHKEIVQYLPAHRGGAWLRLKCISPCMNWI